jgi:hypothetical protein
MSTRPLTTKDGVPQIVRLVDEHGLDKVGIDADSLIRFASEAIRYGEHSLFNLLPAAIDRMIERKAWKERDPPFADFGQMALHPSGLGVTNNRALALLKASMDVQGRHLEAWADVLAAVDKSVKTYLKESGVTLAEIRKNPEKYADTLSYSPSAASADSQLLNLRQTDRTTFRQVVKGQTTLAKVVKERKPVKPDARFIRMKSAWSDASKAERKKFLAWLETDEA